MFSKKLPLQGCGDVWNVARSHTHPHQRGEMMAPMIYVSLGTGFGRQAELLSITHVCTHMCTSTLRPSNTHVPHLESRVAHPRCWINRGQERPLSQAVFISLSRTYQVSVLRLEAVWAAAMGECSPSPHPLLPCQLLVFLQIPAERAFCKETSSASKPKSGSYSYPTLLMLSPSAAFSQAFMLATIWSVSPTHILCCMPDNSSGNWHIIGAH